ncbi:MAG TPA: TetR/AcrR family transcriptional regulator [Terriglobales bacterium]|nr:TetR/AcrR family transcriptional regulator [Terriglobales bacterium]
MLRSKRRPVLATDLGRGRRQRRSEQTRSRLMMSALHLLQQRSFAKITVEEITESADVGKGTFFNYFPSKEHVMVAMIAEFAQLFEARRLEFTRTQDIRKTLYEFVHFITTHPPRTPLLMRNILSTAMSNELMKKPFCKTLKIGEKAVTLLFSHGQKIGQVRNDVPAAQLARAMQQLAVGTQAVWSLHGEGSLQERLDDALDVFWSGIAVTDSNCRLKRTEKTK